MDTYELVGESEIYQKVKKILNKLTELSINASKIGLSKEEIEVILDDLYN